MRRSALLFLLVVIAQLAVPAWMIVAHERVLREGEVFKFRTAPIDPRDPFRGEYVSLNFEAEQGSWEHPTALADSVADTAPWVTQSLFASLGVSDTSGFAVITSLSDLPPTGPYVEVECYGPIGGHVDRVQLPFDRFYLEEGDGAKTESMLLPQWEEGHMSQPLPAYALVRVHDGQAVIVDLVVGDKSIYEWLKEK